MNRVKATIDNNRINKLVTYNRNNVDFINKNKKIYNTTSP
jgi:hypothetical protein